MEMISELMGISFGQADLYRRALEKPEKGNNAKIVARFNDTVIEKAKSLGYSEKVANEVRKLIIDNSAYGFNKSHSICYSLISYWTAWFKCNYPLVFYTVMLNSCDDTEFHLFLITAKKIGININPPNINKSKFLCTIEDDNTIRIGLKSIKGIGIATVKCIERLQPFSSLDEFFKVKTSAVNKGALEAFANIGAFTGLGIEIEDEDIIEYDNILVKDNKLYLNNEQIQIFFKKYFKFIENKTIPNYAIPLDLIKGKIINSFGEDLIIESDINAIVVSEDKLKLLEVELTEEEKKKYKTRKKPKGILKTLQQNKHKISIFRQIINLYKNDILNAQTNPIEKYVNEINVLGYSFMEHPCNKFINKIYDQKNPKSTFDSMSDNSIFMTCGIIVGLEERVSKNNNKYYLLYLNTPVDNVTLQLWNNQFENYKDILKMTNIIKVSGTKGFGRMQVSKLGIIK